MMVVRSLYSSIKKLSLALACVLGAVVAAPVYADASDISAAARSVVRIVVFSSAEGQQTIVSIGSGVVVDRNKVITNAHVVEQARFDDSVEIVVVPSDGTQSYRATVSAVVARKDLALLQLSKGALVPQAYLRARYPMARMSLRLVIRLAWMWRLNKARRTCCALNHLLKRGGPFLQAGHRSPLNRFCTPRPLHRAIAAGRLSMHVAALLASTALDQ
jgi:hypothetical protein